MIGPGESAPTFTLPAVRNGEIEEIALETFLGREIVILAFYPGDFNPACTGDGTGLDELDLFTMQKDVTVLAISGDSVYSHRAFADRYGLDMPLLSDADGTVADRYGVAVDDDLAGHLTQRAVVVVDHTGTVQFTWQRDDPSAVLTADEVRDAVDGIGDDQTAESRYRVGHARYIEGRRAFTSAMKAYEQREWMMAQTDFSRAAEEFEEAGEEFDTAVRFAERTQTSFERAEDKAEALWRAAGWLADSASAFASGEGGRAETLREDAEAPLETARDLDEPPSPDDLTAGGSSGPDDGRKEHPLAEEEDPASTLAADIGTAERGPDGMTRGTDEQDRETDGDDTGEIDEAELEEITAELEEQTDAAELAEPRPARERPVHDETDEADGDDSAGVDLELTDPDGDDEKTEGDHGVPDSP